MRKINEHEVGFTINVDHEDNPHKQCVRKYVQKYKIILEKTG